MAALPGRAWLTKGAAAHPPRGVVRLDRTTLEAVTGWSQGLAAAVDGVVAARERHTGFVVHHGPLTLLVQVQRVHSVHFVNGDRQRARAQSLAFANKLE